MKTPNASPSNRVVEAVAAATGRDPLSLDPPLYEAIDPDALDTLVETGATEVTFQYAGSEVHIDSRGTVHVDGRAFHRTDVRRDP